MKIFLVLMLISFQAMSADPFPKCVRPSDFSRGKFVASYEACLSRQQKFCQTHKLLKDCEKLNVKHERPFYKVTVDDIDPTKRCKILKDESYRCIQDPVRFVGPTNNQGIPIGGQGPSAGSAPSSGSGPSSSDVPFESQTPSPDSTAPPAAQPTTQPLGGPAPPLHAPKK